MKKLTIGLIGNPNSGKTTLFNQLTGARQRVGNWAGVTVERKEGQFTTTDNQVTLVDLPGTYSLTTISSQTSLDEQIACHYILSGDADLLINVVDASNLERNLYLTLQLLELGFPASWRSTCLISQRSRNCASTSMPSQPAWAARWFHWSLPAGAALTP
jgi:Fe2+ transport system protein B